MPEWRARLGDLHCSVRDRQVTTESWDETTQRARELSTAAVVLDALTTSLDELRDAAIDRLPHEVAAALDRVAPSFDISTIASYPPAALQGLGNAVKGALFELQVADAVIHGDLQLPNGVAALHLVDDFATPGYDAQLLDAHGHVVDVIQLKTSQASSIIADHLDRYPDIPHVWASHEAAVDAVHHGIHGVVDTHISDAHLTSVAHGALLDQATTSVGEVVDEIIPQITYAIIAAQAGWRLLQGDPPADVIAWARHRAGAATAMSAIAGVAAMATGTDIVRLPVVIGVSMARVAYVDLDGSAHRLQLMADVVGSLRRLGL